MYTTRSPAGNSCSYDRTNYGSSGNYGGHCSTDYFVPATPGPTDTLQSNWAVSVQVQSNGQAINPQVIYTFNGGMGMNLIPEIDVMLTRSDGTVEIGNFTQPMSIGQTVSLPGTTGNNDRAEVWVITPQGDRVKIVDKYVPFRSYS